MSNYIFIESRDPFESRDTSFVTETATALQKRGHEVTVFLVQNGVLAVRGEWLSALSATGVKLLADEFSLAERGIQADEVFAGVKTSDIGALVDLLVREQTKALWH